MGKVSAFNLEAIFKSCESLANGSTWILMQMSLWRCY